MFMAVPSVSPRSDVQLLAGNLSYLIALMNLAPEVEELPQDPAGAEIPLEAVVEAELKGV